MGGIITENLVIKGVGGQEICNLKIEIIVLCMELIFTLHTGTFRLIFTMMYYGVNGVSKSVLSWAARSVLLALA